MRFRRLCVLALLLTLGFFVPSAAQEIHTLTTPTSVTTTTWTLTYVGIDVANARIVVNLTSNAGGVLSKTYDSTTTPTGAVLMHTVNTANFSGATSLVKSIYNRLATDGVLPAGSVTGTPSL